MFSGEGLLAIYLGERIEFHVEFIKGQVNGSPPP
jgi:hypothetical protein